MKTFDKTLITTNRICPYLFGVVSLSKVFTPNECKQIINTALNDWKENDGLIHEGVPGELQQNSVEDFDYRNTTLFIPPSPDEWLFNKIFATIMNCNNQETGYQFHVQGLLETPNMMRYQAANIDKHGKPGHYDWHMDLGPSEITSRRKLSYTLILNPDEYEGGELCFKTGKSVDELPDQDEAGTMILFPSYLMHKVTHVTSGTRYAIVGWAHGNSFI